MKQIIAKFIADEQGQDIIEYALLCSFVGFTMAGSITWVRSALQNTYSTWDTNYQTDALVEVPDPN